MFCSVTHWDVPEIHAGIKHRGYICVTKRLRVHLRPQAGDISEAPQPPRGRVAVHPGAAAVEQDRPVVPQAGRPVDGPADRWRQRDLDDLGAFTAYAQDPVAVKVTNLYLPAPMRAPQPISSVRTGSESGRPVPPTRSRSPNAAQCDTRSTAAVPATGR
jgi:hypothetical protein